MNPGRLPRQFARPKEPIHPTQILPDGTFAGHADPQPARALFRDDVIDEAILTKVNTSLP